MKKLTLLEVKAALWDDRFRKLFPEHEEEIQEFIKNPGCACNVELYRKLMNYKDRLSEYFPTREIISPQDELEVASRNYWKVINCHVDDLEKNLKKLGNGRKQIAIARWEDQITLVVNEIDLL